MSVGGQDPGVLPTPGGVCPGTSGRRGRPVAPLLPGRRTPVHLRLEAGRLQHRTAHHGGKMVVLEVRRRIARRAQLSTLGADGPCDSDGENFRGGKCLEFDNVRGVGKIGVLSHSQGRIKSSEDARNGISLAVP